VSRPGTGICPNDFSKSDTALVKTTDMSFNIAWDKNPAEKTSSEGGGK
jgi:hypothetical protein